jgi:hypothetical protein
MCRAGDASPTESDMRERDTWNTLYGRSGADGRSQAEIDSVPNEQDWGAPEAFTWRDCYEWMLPYIPERGAVLSMACGNGNYLGSIVRAFPAVTGVGFDIADAAVEIGRGHARALGIEDRLGFHRHSFHDDWDFGRRFNLVYSIYAMQFSTSSQIAPLMARIRASLAPEGAFCCQVRSTSRAVPASYTAVPGERNTYVSAEPHELGMVYHHYDEADLARMTELLGGEIVYKREILERREYDPYPERGWWQFTIRV